MRSEHTSPGPSSGPAGPSGESREVEWQLAAPDLAVVRRWLDQHGELDGLRIEPLPAQQLHDTYLDTDDWRIFRAGFALRMREKGGKEAKSEATLKGLRSARDDAADRRELTEAVPDAKAKALASAAGPVGSRVRDVTGTKPLRPLFEVRTSRQRFAVRRRHPSAELGEIALDEAHFSRGDGQRRPLVLTRVELEATGPDPAPLEQLTERLRSECELRPATENKFAVGLRTASLEPPRTGELAPDSKPQPPIIEPATRAVEFATAELRRLAGEWQAHEPAARLGEDPEGLHALRVTGRRMDTILSLFRAHLPPSLSNKGRRKLKNVVRALGSVRDADIRLQEVSSFRDRLPQADRPALDPLLRHLESERSAARSRMLRALDAKPTRHWLETLPDQLASIMTSRAPTSRRNAAALDVVPELIRDRYRKLHRRASRLSRKSTPLGEYHKVRVRTKKLRYALEAVAPTYGRPAEEMVSALHKVQSRLGTQHDSDTLAQYLTSLSKHPPDGFSGETLFVMGRMAEHHAGKAARLGPKAAKRWHRVRGKHWRALRSRMKAARDAAGTSRAGADDKKSKRPIARSHGAGASQSPDPAA